MAQQAERIVTKIDATRTFYSGVPVDVHRKRNAAGYARVSTDHDEQFTSYAAQVDYYTKYIMQNPDWNFVEVYTDEGISGTSRKKRDGFNRMIKDALDGKIDVIITKSISRFARNTVDTLTTVRELKDHGVEVIFEKENIHTFDSNGEMLITIMSSIAQEESRSISANITWGHRKRFADGKLLMAFSSFLGYDRGPNGEPVINEEQAEIVRRIYFDFTHGMTPSAIAKQLTKEQVPTPAGCSVWKTTTVEHILKNEKYKGCALLQKSFTVDFLTKKTKVNEGEVPQYYVENSHPAIIDPGEWELAQIEFERRARLGRKYVGGHLFSCKIVCADCGGYFGAKIWNSTSKYRRRIWQCNDIVRQLQNVERTYEIISGHRRVRAALRVGLSVVPAYVLPLSDEDAAVVAVTCNLHRSRILPSEKARSLCLLSEALWNRAGTTQRNPDNAGEDRTAQRYMKLVDLIPELLEMVDAGRIAFLVGVELSFLKMSEQNYLLECIGEYDCTPSYSQAVRLRRESCAGTITPETIRDLLSQRKPNQRERIKLDYEKYARFFPGSYTRMQIEQDILRGLELLKIRREKAGTNR